MQLKLLQYSGSRVSKTQKKNQMLPGAIRICTKKKKTVKNQIEIVKLFSFQHALTIKLNLNKIIVLSEQKIMQLLKPHFNEIDFLLENRI